MIYAVIGELIRVGNGGGGIITKDEYQSF